MTPPEQLRRAADLLSAAESTDDSSLATDLRIDAYDLCMSVAKALEPMLPPSIGHLVGLAMGRDDDDDE